MHTEKLKLDLVKNTRRALYIDPISELNWILTDAFCSIYEELNLNQSEFSNLSDWVLTSLLQDSVVSNNVRVLNHYRYDEGLAMKDAIPARLKDTIISRFQDRFKFVKNTDMKVMVSGSEMLVAVRLLDES